MFTIENLLGTTDSKEKRSTASKDADFGNNPSPVFSGKVDGEERRKSPRVGEKRVSVSGSESCNIEFEEDSVGGEGTLVIRRGYLFCLLACVYKQRQAICRDTRTLTL